MRYFASDMKRPGICRENYSYNYKMLHIFQIAESLNMTVQKLEETQSQVDDIRTSITPVEVGFFFSLNLTLYPIALSVLNFSFKFVF